ncbi:MAG: LptF/LptG family permease [Endomicrobiaceae bacterium]|nr:LptF/LptG family permease [Endomicrobiaceae bacterium]
MKIYLYISKQFLKPLFFTTFAFGFIVLISELFREMNFYMEKKTPFLIILEYLFLNFPWWSIDVFALSVLLALLFSLGDLAKRNEITILKASGINVWNIIFLFLFLGFSLGIIDFAAREFIIPKTVTEASYVRNVKIEKNQDDENLTGEYKNIIVALKDNTRMSIGYLNVQEGYMRNIIIDEYYNNFYLKKNIVVGEALYNNHGWLLKNGVERKFDNSNKWEEKYFQNKIYPISVKPNDFVVKDIRYEQMNLKDFKEYIQKNQMLGKNTLKDQIKYNMRFAGVFCHIIVMMIGIPFALGLGKRFGKIISFTVALMLSFIYWTLQGFALTLGENQVLSITLAAWLPNIIFCVIGIYLLSRIKT